MFDIWGFVLSCSIELYIMYLNKSIYFYGAKNKEHETIFHTRTPKDVGHSMKNIKLK